jgi:hypothetical protein
MVSENVMIKIEEWILEDIRRIRKIPKADRSPDEHSYMKILMSYTKMVESHNYHIAKVKSF